MPTKNSISQTGIALVLSVIWIWIMLDDFILAPWWLRYAVTSVMYVLTIFGIYRITRTGQRLHTLVLVPCTLALAVVMFTLWGTALSIQLPEFPGDFPLPIRLSTMFIGGLLSSLVVALLFVYPLTVLMPRVFWLVPMITALFVAWNQLNGLIDPQTLNSTRYVMFYELLCLFLLVPLLIWFMSSRVRKHIKAVA